MYLWTATGSPQTNDSERGITMKKIGAITVGQSPRVDLIPEIQPILGDSVEIIQAGALDGLSKEEIAKFVPRPGENVLVSRLTDGTSATFGESYILPRLQLCIDDLEQQGVSLILFLCTAFCYHQGESHQSIVRNALGAIFIVENAIAIEKPKEQSRCDTFITIAERMVLGHKVKQHCRFLLY